MGKSFKEFILWQNSMLLVELVYKVTAKLPVHEIHGLASQMRRCAVSIPSNIAEGSKRNGRKEYSHFLQFAYGSSAELETQLLISKKIYRLTGIEECLSLNEELQKMLSVSIKKLSN